MTGVTRSLVKGRRLSPLRLLLLCMILAGLIAGGIFGVTGYMGNVWLARAAVHNQWFAPYVDVTATPTFMFQNLGSTPYKDVVLAFIVSDLSGPCEPSWGGAYTLDQASEDLDLDRRIARLKQQGGSVAVSFGGVRNNELAVGCTDSERLVSAYQSVVDKYQLNTIDLDLENDGLTDADAGRRRALAIAELQSARRAVGKPLAVWVTLPVTPLGLSQDGTNAVEQLLKHGVDLAGVNVMTMDYGASLTSDHTMLSASKSALLQTKRQLKILYQRSELYLSDTILWSKIGATPMIGQNDFKNEVFTMDDAQALNRFALANGVGRLSMWSANRDLMCGSNYVDVSIVSDACSGVEQSPFGFSTLLGSGYKISMDASAGFVTTSDQVSASLQEPDDPATSPYQIWSQTARYLAGEKVVWHRNVYEAKWWTQGDIPDNPVLQSWETPWNLIGPVLPGEKPISQPTLPENAYPAWSVTEIYDGGQRVIFEGMPYQAKWWSQGESPASASEDPDSSAWAPLTQAEINAIITNLHKRTAKSKN